MKRRVESSNEREALSGSRSSPFFSSRASESGPLRNLTGFSLLELSVVLAIVAVLTAGTFSMGSSMVESVRKVNTWNKLDTIEEALLAFRLANNRLPCPTDATLTDIPANANTFGWEAGYATPNSPDGTCSGGSPTPNFTYAVAAGTPAAANASIGTTVVEGAVPVRSLSLPDEFQFDGWGRKFGYAVWTPLTATRAFLTYGLSPNCGAITVENAGHGYRSTAAAYALISYGPDGHGGYLKSGSPTRYNAGSDNADEITNAHYSSTGVNTSYKATYIEKDWTQDPGDSNDNFDDTVRFMERWQMQNAYDTYVPNGAPCIPGFRIDGNITNGNIGMSMAVADINGDGIPDLLIIGADPVNAWYDLYVVFGQPNSRGFPNPLPLSTLNGTNGFVLTDIGNGTNMSMAGPDNPYPYQPPWLVTGDLNGDGIADVYIADYVYNCPGTATTTSFILFGQSGGNWPTTPTDITTLTNTTSPRVTQIQSGACGGAAIADINGDGINDLIIGDQTYGPLATGTVTFTANPTNGLTIILNGVTWTFTTGAPGHKKTVIQGTLASTLAQLASDLNSPSNGGLNSKINVALYYASATVLSVDYGASGTQGNSYTLNAGTAANSVSGAKLTGGIGSAGGAYVYFGHAYNGAHPWGASESIGQLTGGTESSGGMGFVINGTATNEGVGSNIAAGDFNGDGIQDILIGSVGLVAGTPGQAVLIWGRNSSYSWPPRIDMTNQAAAPCSGSCWPANGSAGVLFTIGTANNGYSFADNIAAGDINGDGIADLIIGDYYYTEPGPTGGATWIVYGKGGGAGTPPWPGNWNGGVPTNAINIATPVSGMAIRMDAALYNQNLGTNAILADINGDGKMDLIMDSGGYDVPCGGAGGDWDYVFIFNNAMNSFVNPPTATTWSLSSLYGTNGGSFWINEAPCDDYWSPPSGSYFRGNYNSFTTGNVNKGAYNDVIVGEGGQTVGNNANSGSTWIIWGGTSFPNNGSFDDSATYKGTTWIRLDGDYANEFAGSQVVTGDFDHNGMTDIAIAAPGNTPGSNNITNAGSVYVIWGGKNLSSEVPGGAISLENMVNR